MTEPADSSPTLRDDDLVLEPTSGADDLHGFAVLHEGERIGTVALQSAHGKGLEQGTDGYELLQTWLKKKPDSELFTAWESYIKALTGQLNEEQNRLLKNQIVGFAKMVAAAAGGILGFGKVSGDEEKVLNRIEGAFPR